MSVRLVQEALSDIKRFTEAELTAEEGSPAALRARQQRVELEERLQQAFVIEAQGMPHDPGSTNDSESDSGGDNNNDGEEGDEETINLPSLHTAQAPRGGVWRQAGSLG